MAFTRIIPLLLKAMGWIPDVIHVNDWHCALLPVLIKVLYHDDPELSSVATVMGVHNIAYQGTFWHYDMELTGLPWGHYRFDQLEHYNYLNLLKGGIVFADAVATVSPTYAKEIQTPEYGCGLDDVLRHHSYKVSGILNGISAGCAERTGSCC